VTALGQRTLDGIGRQAGPLRPDYGPDWAELACDQCAATWVGRIGDPCDWCEKALERMQREKGIDLSWPEPEPLHDNHDRPLFPVHVFPGWIRDHVIQVADEMQFPVDLPAQLAITALSIACAGNASVIVRGTWREQLNTYLVTAMPPGAGKSPAFNAMLRPLDEWEQDLVARQAPERDRVETTRQILEKEKAKKINAGETAEALALSDEIRDLPDVAIPQLMADDATPEKVAMMLQEQQGRLALVSTEGGLFSMMAGRYAGDKGPNLDVYLQAWSGDTVRVNRVGRDPVLLRNPTLTIGLTVQPLVISDLSTSPQFSGRGLLARFMFSIPATHVGYRDMAKAPSIVEAVADTYRHNLVALAERLRLTAETGPLELFLHDDALERFNEWRQDIEVRRRPGGDLAAMAEWTTKMESTVARLAALLALAEGAQTPIDREMMERAITVGRYWECHARLAHDMWGADPTAARAGRIVDWALAEGRERFSLRDTYKHVDRTMTPEDAVDALELLVDKSWIRSADGRELAVGKRGVPSPEFTLNPHSVTRSSQSWAHGHHGPKSNTEFSLSLSVFGDEDAQEAAHAHGAHGAHDCDERVTALPAPEEVDPVDNSPDDMEDFPWD
jgi:replicative DNA helicase